MLNCNYQEINLRDPENLEHTIWFLMCVCVCVCVPPLLTRNISFSLKLRGLEHLRIAFITKLVAGSVTTIYDKKHNE